MVTQAPATASACFQLATLAQKERCPRALSLWDPRLLRSPHKDKALGLICRLADVNPLQPRNSGLHMLNLLAYLAPTSFSFGEGACSSPPLRKNDGRIPPEQSCCHVLWLAATKDEYPL